jgi:hypothetical protein
MSAHLRTSHPELFSALKSCNNSVEAERKKYLVSML